MGRGGPTPRDPQRASDPPRENNGVSNPNGKPHGMAKANEVVRLMEEAGSLEELACISENEIKTRQWDPDALYELRAAYAAIAKEIERKSNVRH